MPTKHTRSVAEQLMRVPSGVRPTVAAARRLVRAIAPHAVERGYRSQPPRSPRALWKLARYTVEGANVVGIGTFRTYALLFFFRGRELEDRTGPLEGGGKTMRFIRLPSPAETRRPKVRRTLRKAFRLAEQEGSD